MRVPTRIIAAGVLAAVAGAAAGGTFASRDRWMPLVLPPAGKAAEEPPEGHDHAGHEHGESDANAVTLSDQARANLGLKVGPVELSDYTKNLVIPATVVEQPGHSERRVTTPLSGVVTKVHAFPGQAVRPGDPLFDVQPMGEQLTNGQAGLIKTLQDLELVGAELDRIAPLVENGSIPARNKLEKDYERKRLESQRQVQIQELLVRGMTPDQITEMVEHKTLLKDFTIHVPGAAPAPAPKAPGHDHPPAVPPALRPRADGPSDGGGRPSYTVESIAVFPGKMVEPGDELCGLALHTELYVEGQAFESDGRSIADAVREQRPVAAIFEGGDSGEPDVREGLRIRYVENALDPVTRTQRFFVPLKNEVVRDTVGDNGVVYRSWRFKPGQKVRLLLPEQKLAGQIVLPAAAVVSEGPDAFVFRANGGKMERVAVVVEHRDPRSVVIRNDGSVFLGDEIALSDAYQINLALKKQQGSGADPHAGHNH